MPYDATPAKPWTDPRRTAPAWTYDASGNLTGREPRLIEAIAEHGYGAIGGMLPLRDCTTVTLRDTLNAGGIFIATLGGHVEDGSTVEMDGDLYRMNVVRNAQRRTA